MPKEIKDLIETWFENHKKTNFHSNPELIMSYSFNAGAQAMYRRDAVEIERLKGLAKGLWEQTFYNIPIPDYMDQDAYEKAFNNAWEQFKKENKL